MSSWNDLLESPRPQEHLVQFTGSERDLARNVAAYLKAGADRGDYMIVLATPSRRELFSNLLRTAGANPEELSRLGRLTMLDAAATLAGFLQGDQPDWERFDSTVGKLVRETKYRAGAASLRAYGEMVDLLWQAGNLRAATKLEEFWNRLLEEGRFSLFCAYTVNLLGGDDRSGALQEMLSTHTHLLPVRSNGELEAAVDRALDEVLGAPSAAALRPLVRANQHPRTVIGGAEATVLWLRKNLPRHAPVVLLRARAFYEEECARSDRGSA